MTEIHSKPETSDAARQWSDWLLSRSGQLLIVLGLLHLPVYLLFGDSWEGPVSWRKPILFGVSTGMTLWSLGWIASHLKRTRFDRVFGTVVSITLVVEVLLITWQQWRGQASHFNRSSSFAAIVDYSMLVLITIAFAGICYFAIRCCGRLNLAADYRVAARLGMFFLILSCVIGFVISAYGYRQIEQGLSPEKVGDNGVTKFPHGIAIHALQLFPLLVFGMQKLGADMRMRLTVLWSAVTSTAFFTVFAIVQTVSGQARFELESVYSIGLLILGVGALVGPPIAVLVKSRNSSSDSKARH